MDAVLKKAKALFEKSGRTLEDLGSAMGYKEGVARRAAWQFLNSVADPRLSMLRRFCKAMGVTLEELVSEKLAKK